MEKTNVLAPLHYNQAWFERLMAHSPLGVFVFDGHGHIIDCNDLFVSLMGSSREQLIGLNTIALPDLRVVNAIKQTLAGETVRLEIDYRSVTGGKLVPLRATFVPVQVEEQVVGGLGLLEDLTYSREATTQTKRQIAFEKLVATASSRLVNAPIDRVDEAINQALAEIGQFFSVDRCYIFQYDEQGSTLSNTHEWCAEGIQAEILNLQNLARADFAWSLAQLDAQQVIHLPEVAAMPDELAFERDFILAQGIQSILLLPLIENGSTHGFFGIDAVRSQCEWPQDKIVLLQLMAETIGNAFARRRVEKAMRKLNMQYQQFSSQVPLGLYSLRLTTKGQTYFEYCNDLFLSLNGVEEPSEVLALRHVHPDDVESYRERQQFAWRKQRAFVWEGRFILKGKVRWMRIEDALPHIAKNGDLLWNGFQQDITERKQLEQRLKELATIDDMTQIWNRRSLMSAAEEEFERAQRYGGGFSFLMIDADRFKQVNDEYGHAAGDEVLINLARIMKQSVRKVDMVGRLGGEEFAILLPNTPPTESALLAERIRMAVENNPVTFAGQTLVVTISIGVASYDTLDKDLDQLIQRADKALYQAKHQGRNRCVIARIE